ncbi:MAG: HAD family phosphatase [Chitinivibrionales bacterium]|nr:HAD family phosphatase [Chitinivibrionales bacterium]
MKKGKLKAIEAFLVGIPVNTSPRKQGITMNIVFDVGNVLVTWSPAEIVRRTFGKSCDTDGEIKRLFRNTLWRDLNLGTITEVQAKREYLRQVGLDADQVDRFFFHIRDSLDLIDGTVDLVRRLHQARYPLYALTDNIREIVDYLKVRYDFWSYFLGAIVSAEVQLMKPGVEIYAKLCTEFGLKAEETIFIDDHLPNVEGARAAGLIGIQFQNASQCEQALFELGIIM